MANIQILEIAHREPIRRPISESDIPLVLPNRADGRL